MKMNIRGDKVLITDSIREYIESKLVKLEKYFDDTNLSANIVVRLRGRNQIIEVTIPTKHFTLRAEESNEDFYSAVDLVVSKLERQIRKNKERLNNKYKNIEKLEFNFSTVEDDEEVEENVSTIIKRKNISMKPMDEEEAMLQIELLNHDFFVFKNIDEECVSVLYKRKDGNYGIINMK